ncbi:MAG: hypothetical protein JOZ31_22360 [Verrucomicrobia bacterium]|nr:hypothetical protein [Verrucomicrobiota bacterium]
MELRHLRYFVTVAEVGASEFPVPKRLRDFAELPFVGLDRNDFSEYWRFIDRLCETYDLRLRLILEAKEKHSLMMLVAGGMGVSILPAHVADSVHGTLRIVPIPDLTEEIPVAVAFQRHSQNPTLIAFIEVLKDCLELRFASSVPQKPRASSVGAKSL